MNFNEKNELLYFCKFINIMYMYTYIFSITLGSNHGFAEGKAGASSYLHNPTPPPVVHCTMLAQPAAVWLGRV